MGSFDQFLRRGVFWGVLGKKSALWAQIDVLVSQMRIKSVNLVRNYIFYS